MFACSATTGAVKNHHFDLAYDAFLGDDDTRNFIKNVNAPALKEIAEKFMEAIDRNLWQPGRMTTRELITRPISSSSVRICGEEGREWSLWYVVTLALSPRMLRTAAVIPPSNW
jgi:cobalamin biosynthesis Mg chelatase CobN